MIKHKPIIMSFEIKLNSFSFFGHINTFSLWVSLNLNKITKFTHLEREMPRGRETHVTYFSNKSIRVLDPNENNN